MRRVWAPVGQRPIARFNRGYKWTYLYGFVRPRSGGVYWLILPTVNVVELFSMALQEFAKEVGAGEDKHVLVVLEVVLDQAGWHTGGEVELPEGIHLEFLPKGSPELQPAERLWPLTNEAIANRLFEEIEEIEEALVKRCIELLEQGDLS
jgi:DDE superfamily endonuclease